MNDISTPVLSNRSRRHLRRLAAVAAAITVAVSMTLAGGGAAFAGEPTNPLTTSDVHASTKQGQSVSLTLQGSGPAGDDIHFWMVGQPGHGSVTQPAVSPTVTYTPAAGFSGTDTFTYRVSDSMWDSPVATATIDVAPASPDNHAPVAQPLALSVESGDQLLVTFSATDADGDQLSYRVATSPAHGTTDGSGDNVTYIPDADYTGPDSFTYVASDGVVDSAPATVSITVEPQRPNHVPTSEPPTVTVAQDSSVRIHLPASDADGDQIWFSFYNDQAHGTFGDPDYDTGDITYTPALGFQGTDSFHYDVSDHRSTSQPYLVTITVTAAVVPAHVPVARSFDVNASTGSATPITLQGTDPDGDALTYTVTAPPAYGTLSGSGSSLVYTTDSVVLSQTDSFTYTVSDGVHTSTPAQVLISLYPPQVPTAPVPAETVSSDHVSRGGRLVAQVHGGGLIVVFVSADGSRSATQKVTSVAGGDVDWSLVSRSNRGAGTAEVWEAFVPYDPTDGLTVTAQLAHRAHSGSITAVTFSDYVQIRTSVAAAGRSKTPQADVTPFRAGSMVWVVGHGSSRVVAPQPLAGETISHAFSDRRSGDAFWVQSTASGLPDAPLTVGATLPHRDRWQLVAVEVSIG